MAGATTCDRASAGRYCPRSGSCGRDRLKRTRRSPAEAGHYVRDMDLSVRIGSLTLKNPLIAASGCFGYGVEYADVVDLSALGAIVSKGLFLQPREGHSAPRIVETPAGMV